MSAATKKKLLVIISCLVVVALACVLGFFISTNLKASDDNGEQSSSSSSQNDQTDSSSEINKVPGSNIRKADESENVVTAQQAYQKVQDRGFDGAVIISTRDINGKYTGMTELDPSSTDRHPNYEFDYNSPQGLGWNVYVNDGDIFAALVTVNGHGLNKVIILSETDYVVRYNGKTNEYSTVSFDEIAPTKVIKVDSITPELLDSYTADTVEGL